MNEYQLTQNISQLSLKPGEEEIKKKGLVAVLEEKIIMDETTAVKKGKPLINGFIPQLKGKKVIIRLVSGSQPITGTIESYNPYEILLQTAKGQVLVFKHAIAVLETVDMPKQEFTIRE